MLRHAVSWFVAEQAYVEAVQCCRELADASVTRRLLVDAGSAMLTQGMARPVLEALADLDPAGEHDDLLLLEAEARQMLGDWEGATACYRQLAPGDGPLTPGLAWRLGFLSHMRGDVAAALVTYRRGLAVAGPDRDRAALLGWAASAHWLRGEREQARALATDALRLAREAADSGALATAHTVLAMVAALDGDRASNDHHYLRALEHAERARDVVQTIRIRSNRASHFLEEGRFDEALAELDIAHRLSDLTGFSLWRAMALSNRGQVQFFRGRLEESLDDLQAARAIFRTLGSTLEAYPLAYIGDVYRTRGHASLARSAYEEAIRLAEGPSDQQALVPALSGLARLLTADDPQQALAVARRSSSVGSAVSHARAVVAEGWAELACGRRQRAVELADTAARTARTRHDIPGLAEANELMASAGDPAESMHRLEEAKALWSEIGAPIGVATADVAIAALIGGPDGAMVAERSATTLRNLGAKGIAWEATNLALRLARTARPGVAITSLGAFGVSIDGRAVPADAWQSRIARDVLAMLVANRGRPIHREVLLERIWPDDDPAKSSNRLSVAVSTIRSVLDPDRRHDPDHFVGGEKDTLVLQLDQVIVDIEDFLDDAHRGLTALRAGRADDAAPLLDRAESRYVGEFLEDRPHADWATSTREEARATYVQIARIMAGLDLATGDHDSAARRYLRILERDPYDESAHLELIATMSGAGRHGTARQLYGAYAARMAELDVEPAPFPEARDAAANPTPPQPR
jgi:DNA-binding SARP family transcriptional activator